MTQLNYDLNVTNGEIKMMHCVNNGPVVARFNRYGNMDLYKALEIPYARFHDSSFAPAYGGEWSVDVHRIFRNFDADENDPSNYIFGPTDKYVRQTVEAGTMPYYRLGVSVEHHHKCGSLPPKDYHKWARVAANIIRHYTQGWGDGFNYNMDYWEIWNEFDCVNPDGENPFWQGTPSQFIDFYEVVAKHLKSSFPHLKIGGPAFTSSWHYDFIRPFLKAVKERSIPLDFYSFHGYMRSPIVVKELYDCAIKTFEEAGLEKVSFHLNEWNYMRSWSDSYKYSTAQMGKIKGASFVLGSMCVGQSCDIDMMMYYDARPSTVFNGLFTPFFYEPMKPYFSFKFFRDVYKLKNAVVCDAVKDDIYAVASTNGGESAIAFTYFTPEDDGEDKAITVNVKSVKPGSTVQTYLLDEKNDGVLVKEETAESDYTANITMKLFDTYLIKIKEA